MEGIMLLANLKIDYVPLVLVKTLFNTVQHKTNIKGYWKDSKGKLYIDNIELRQYKAIDNYAFRIAKDFLFAKGEKCIAYKNYYNELIIAYPNNENTILKNRIAWIENKKPSRKYILELLKNTEGLTIYKLKDNKYLIETYK